MRAHPVDRFVEPFTVVRLEQIIERVRLECFQRELVVRRAEDDGRHRRAGDGIEHFEAVESRHLHVEKNQVRCPTFDLLHGFLAAAAFTDDFNVFVFFEMKPNAVAGEGFVIYDQCSNHACLASVNSSCLTRMYGMRMRTSAPPSARLLISNENCALYNCSK